MLPQIKASESARLLSELEEVLSLLTENVNILNCSILNQQNSETKGSTMLIVEEEAEKLLHIYRKRLSIAFQSPVAPVRLNDALKKYTGEFLTKSISAVVTAKIASMTAGSLPNISLQATEDADATLVDKLRLDHVRSYSKTVKLMNHCQELRLQRDELLVKVNSALVASHAQIDGLRAKRNYLEGSLNTLKCLEAVRLSSKLQMRDAIKFSAEFEKLFMENKTKFKALNSYLNNLWKSVSSSKLKTLESYNRALESTSLLSNLIKGIWRHNDGKTINLASSAAANISQCSHTPYLSVRINPPLYLEICKRLGSAPFITPINKILDRLNSVVVDCKSIDLINNELSHSLDVLKTLHDSLQTSLETSRNAEKGVCLAMAEALKKISSHCAKVIENQAHLDNIWNYWSEFIPRGDNPTCSLDDLVNL